MNIVVVTAQFPFPPRSGMTMRVYQLVRQLARRHQVTLLSYPEPGYEDAVAELRKELRVRVVDRRRPPGWARRAAQVASIASAVPFSSREVYSKELQHELDALCRSTACDVVQLEGTVQCRLSVPRGVRVILDEHNIDYEVFERMRDGERSLARRAFNRWEYERVRRFEQKAWTRVDGCLVTSEREEPIVQAFAPNTPTAVVPNGVDLDYFAPGGAIEPRTLVFNGLLGYRPNFDAALHLVDDIWPSVLDHHPDAQLTIVGRAGEAERRRLSRPGVNVTGEVPDIRPYMRSAAVIAVPVRMGGGTRLKVVEGLAMGKAMVSTTLGCEGVGVRDHEHLLIADGAAEFTSGVIRLFADAELRDRLGAAGRRLIESQYSWDLAGERMEALYQQVLDGDRVPAGQLSKAVLIGG
jgi:polysaccharide biosynthesis protein PslH